MRCPIALLIAVGLGIIFHLVASSLYPTPMARADLREKVRTLTKTRRPSIVISGDSRFESGVMPDLLARELGLPSRLVINMAEAACDSPAIVAAYNEFAHRFQAEPVVILNLSCFAANDGATEILGDELLWPLNFMERADLVGISRAVCTAFLPEKAAWQDLLRFWPGSTSVCSESGFEAVPGHVNVKHWSPEHLTRRAEALVNWWYRDMDMDGLRWHRLRQDLQRLSSARAKLVVVVMPFHPAFLNAINNTPAAQAEEMFRGKLAALCQSLSVPCLTYDATCLGPADTDLLFHDLIHLNRDGATAFTPVLARDLLRCGVLPPPGNALAKNE